MKNENIIVELSGASSATRGKTVKSLEKTGLPLTPIFEGKKSRGNEPEQAKWNLFTTKENQNNWYAAHEVVSKAGKDVITYAEPDKLYINPFDIAKKRAGTKGKHHGDYLSEWPQPKSNEFAWYLDKSNLKKIRHADPGKSGTKIRIAHFDTGYDGDNHESKPLYLKPELGYNFIEGGLPTDKNNTSIKNQPGHGTATMAILAGNKIDLSPDFNDYMGGAPFAEVIPFRISDSVILLKAVEFAQALEMAMQLKCDVVTMSMGGLASKLWAEKVNQAYDAGMVVVSAAGNNFGGGLPTHHVIYPSRFNRVITACGVMYNNTPYYNKKYGHKVMMGNWGPDSVMHTAVAAYTPNVPWATMKVRGDGFGKGGGGTSSATPQVAATAALFLEKFNNYKFAKPWMRAEAARMAILESAKFVEANKKYFGCGILDAEAALNYGVAKTLSKADVDDVRLPFIQLIFKKRGKNEIDRNEMFETEILHLIELDENINMWAVKKNAIDKMKYDVLSKKETSELRDLILASKLASDAIKLRFKSL